MCERCVYVECFASYLVLLVGCHGAEGAHVVQAVSHLYEHDANVLAHGEEELAEVFCLRGGFVAEYAAGYLGESAYEFGNLFAELLLDVLDGVVGVFDNVVQ